MSFEEKHVALFVDKMKVKENVQLNNGKIFGLTLNETEQGKDTVARHIMTWMIQSQAGLMNEAVCMVPVSCMTDEEITNTSLDVIMELAGFGLAVTLYVSDGVTANVKAMEILTDNSIRPGSVQNLFFPHPHPDYTGCKIFTSFDGSHEVKKVKNGWINKRDPRKTYLVPLWTEVVEAQASQERGVDISQWHFNWEHAKFQDLREIYNAKATSMTKEAYKLDFRTVYPTSLEKQSV